MPEQAVSDLAAGELVKQFAPVLGALGMPRAFTDQAEFGRISSTVALRPSTLTALLFQAPKMAQTPNLSPWHVVLSYHRLRLMR